MTFTEVVPYLYYPDADDALDWLERVLGFGPSTRWRLGGKATREADIVVGGSRISVSGRAPLDNEGGGALIIVHVDDIDALFHRVADAVAAEGAEPGTGPALEQPELQAYGPRTFTVTDPWGYRWNFWEGETTIPPDVPSQA